MRGAEAVIIPVEFLGRKLLRKERVKKTYRIKEIDTELRIGRTRREARLLHKAKLAGVNCPTVYEVGADYIVMDKISGRKLGDDPEELKAAGEVLGALHAAGIIHGDFTPYNLIVNSGGIFVIDFGLGSFSKKIESQADDVITMLRGVGEKKPFIEGYRKYPGSGEVLERIEKIESRARYRSE